MNFMSFGWKKRMFKSLKKAMKAQFRWNRLFGFIPTIFKIKQGKFERFVIEEPVGVLRI